MQRRRSKSMEDDIIATFSPHSSRSSRSSRASSPRHGGSNLTSAWQLSPNSRPRSNTQDVMPLTEFLVQQRRQRRSSIGDAPDHFEQKMSPLHTRASSYQGKAMFSHLRPNSSYESLHNASSGDGIDELEVQDRQQMTQSQLYSSGVHSHSTMIHASSGSLNSLYEETPTSLTEQELLLQIQTIQHKLSITELQNEKNIGDDASSNKSEAQIKESAKRRRLIMISNRLPISFTRDKKTGEFQFKMSSGGLVTALNGIRDELPFIWIGWLGQEIPPEEQQTVRDRLEKEFNCLPVFITKEIAELYYNAFSNDLLWPLFHYVPLPLFQPGSEKKFDFRVWDAYKYANDQFAQAVHTVFNEGDTIWVHDYHLMMLPSILRERHPSSKIGWFLHTPFPSAEIFRLLPVGQQILEGLFGADLLGFHTYDYARHFLVAASRVPGVTTSPKGLEYNDRFSGVGVFPIGIDPEHFEKLLMKEETQKRVGELHKKFAGCKVILGVDRMDYTKGMPHRMLAMERFLGMHPECHERIVLIQIAVPSRTGVAEYQHLAATVNEMVGRINGRFGTLQYSPVHFIHRPVTPTELVALYNLADVCLVSPVRDGMNLVSHEYVMCQSRQVGEPSPTRRRGPGVLVLSEFAGSAQSLSGALRMNPWNTRDMVHALEFALSLPYIEREYRQANLLRYVKTHSASYWGKSFFAELQDTEPQSTGAGVKHLIHLPAMEVAQAYANSKKRLIVLNLDETILDSSTQNLVRRKSSGVPATDRVLSILANRRFISSEVEGPPSKNGAKVTQPGGENAHRIVDMLLKDDRNIVALVSSQERGVMEPWMDDYRVTLIAESGYFCRFFSPPNSMSLSPQEWQIMSDNVADVSWKKVVQPIMQYYTERMPGSYIETKDSSLIWHYGETDAMFGPMQARDMQVNLEDVLCNLPLEVLQGTNRVEVRLQGITKTIAMERLLKQLDALRGSSVAQEVGGSASFSPDLMQTRQDPIDFVFCAGNGAEDDDLFTFFNQQHQLAREAAAMEAKYANSEDRPRSGSSGNGMLAPHVKVYTCQVRALKTEAFHYVTRPVEIMKLLKSMVMLPTTVSSI